jgi:hypothetical protein
MRRTTVRRRRRDSHAVLSCKVRVRIMHIPNPRTYCVEELHQDRSFDSLVSVSFVGFRECLLYCFSLPVFVYNCFPLSRSVLASDWRCHFSSSVVKPFIVDISGCCCIRFSIGAFLIFRVYKRSITSVSMQRNSTVVVPTSLQTNMVIIVSSPYTVDYLKTTTGYKHIERLNEYINDTQG